MWSWRRWCFEVRATRRGKAAKTELLVSASAVNGIVGSLGYSAADVLFATAYGVLVDDVLLEVVSVTERRRVACLICIG